MRFDMRSRGFPFFTKSFGRLRKPKRRGVGAGFQAIVSNVLGATIFNLDGPFVFPNQDVDNCPKSPTVDLSDFGFVRYGSPAQKCFAAPIDLRRIAKEAVVGHLNYLELRLQKRAGEAIY